MKFAIGMIALSLTISLTLVAQLIGKLTCEDPMRFMVSFILFYAIQNSITTTGDNT